jgi:hypothetical protein
MSDALYIAVIPPEMLKRGFWLYVWVITLARGRTVHYVGRTGDSSSPHAQSPFRRTSGHLGSNEHDNALQRNLKKHGIEFDQCIRLEVVAHGPLHDEVNDMGAHTPLRDKMHALERDLCNAMKGADYDVLNHVACKTPTDEAAWDTVRNTFARRFERLASR